MKDAKIKWVGNPRWGRAVGMVTWPEGRTAQCFNFNGNEVLALAGAAASLGWTEARVADAIRHKAFARCTFMDGVQVWPLSEIRDFRRKAGLG